MNKGFRLVLFAVFLMPSLPGWSDDGPRSQGWPQWGQNPQHTGVVNASGQHTREILDDVVYDPFVEAEKTDPTFGNGDLHVHYQVPLTDGDAVYMEFKSGVFTSIEHWETQTWNERKLRRVHGQLAEAWSFESDWKPVPFLSLVTGNGPFWEPVFHAALVGDYVYMPGFGGSIFKVAKSDGHLVARINPFGATLDPDTYVAGPLAADAKGNVYYNALKLDHDNPWDVNPPASYLVKVSPDDTARTATIASLTPGAPGAGDQCRGIFRIADLPWPPSPDAVPARTRTCGVQRVPVNSSPAIAPDGTYSIITKDNHYSGFGAYCSFASPFCPRDRTASNPASPEAFFITRLNSNLEPEWSWQNTNTLSCTRDAQGQVSCVSDHPAGFEWCVNAPAVDRNGNVFANSEDGGLYAIRSSGSLRDHLSLDLAIGAAYTPLSIDNEGRILTQNDGHLL